MEHLAGSWPWEKEKGPLDIGPKIEQEESEGSPEETQVNSFGSGACADSIHKPVAGFDAKATAVRLIDLVRCHLEFSNQDIGEAAKALALIASFAIFTDKDEGELLGTLDFAASFIGGTVPFASG